MGGHSGLNINEDRGNAVRFVAQVTNAVLNAAPNARLARIAGGDKRNAIAREASADVVVRTDIPRSTLPRMHSSWLWSEHALGGDVIDRLKQKAMPSIAPWSRSIALASTPDYSRRRPIFACRC